MSELYLGIDTSNYKTSVAVTNRDGDILFERSEYLDVPKGEKGLRQSVAFFQQSNNIPGFVSDVFKLVNPHDIKAVGVSSRPRRIEGSYMPCFLAGCNAARLVSDSLGIPLYHFSHQEGHAAAVIEHIDSSFENKHCLFFHLSGGTTEFLLCDEDRDGYKMDIVGGSKDISFGQLIDRIGVKLGYSFPAGLYMDEIAINTIPSENNIPQIKLKDSYFNLSGIETHIQRYIDSNAASNCESIVSELFKLIASLIYESVKYLTNRYSVRTVYIAGGVASSKAIRKYISKYDDASIDIIFADSKLSGDNAVGISYLTSRVNNQ